MKKIPYCGASRFICFNRYYPSVSIKQYEMGGTRNMRGKNRNAYRVLAGKPEGKRPTEKLRLRWDSNIKMRLENNMGGQGMVSSLPRRGNWRAVVNVLMNVFMLFILCTVSEQTHKTETNQMHSFHFLMHCDSEDWIHSLLSRCI